MKRCLIIVFSLLILGCQQPKPSLVQTYQLNECAATPYRKSLMVVGMQQLSGQSTFNTPHLAKTYLEQFYRKLDPNNIELIYAPEAQIIPPQNSFDHWPTVQQQVLKINHNRNAQYILFGQLSVVDEGQSEVSEVADYFDFRLLGSQTRRTQVTWNVYDGLSGTLLSQSHFALHDDVARRHLRRVEADHAKPLDSVLGQDIIDSLAEQANAISHEMRCQPLRGQIVKNSGGRLFIDIGSSHGLAINDELHILSREEWGDYRRMPKGAIFSPYNRVKVVALGSDTAQIEVLGDNHMPVTRLGDIVTTAN